jgi:hypothetical protein
MTNNLPANTYLHGLEQLNNQLQKLSQIKSQLTWLRLCSFLAAIAAAWITWPLGLAITGLSFAILFGIFIFFVSKDLANNNALEHTRLLIQVHEQELAALKHHYTHFADGLQWKPETHDYAHDLDIFGRASLFQYINRTTSQQGSRLLAQWLLSPSPTTDIIQRQKAIQELRDKKDWRHQLQAHGMATAITIPTQQKIHEWLKEENKFSNKIHWKWLRFILPLLAFTVLVLHLTDIIAEGPFYSLMLLFLAIAFSISKLIMPAYAKLNKITPELESLSASIHCIEHASFNSDLLKQLHHQYGSGNEKASTTIRQLKKILDRLDYRLNPIVFIPLSIFACWDLQQIFALEKWKSRNQQHIDDWFAALAMYEALSSLANLSFNHPGWTFPVISSDNAVFDAKDMGHPLIPASKRVDSSFTIKGAKQIALITGSNMAGKSTFLRSAGVNTVLAMTGAPVCAKQFTVSNMKVMSSMRISDNLEESTSTFYAELKKLKEIIEAVNRKEKVFLLLDEILRGTNSADRHTGSKALVKQLIHHDATGLLATHDLELAKLAGEYPGNIHNYHFDVQVANDELYFDYKLKEGICRSMNASILMKKIGIEL